jgi:glycosyltransferase involved in cell wall biosynthesis
MKIGLVVDPFGEKSPGGLGRAIFEIAKAIIEAGSEHEYTVFLKHEPKEAPAILGARWKLVSLHAKYLWLSAGPRLDKHLDACIFFTPIIPLFFFPKKSIIIVHDFAYLETPAASRKQKITSRLLYLLHARSLKKASTIVAVSEAAKESTIRHFHISPEKVQVIYNGFIVPDATPQKIETPEKFFLFAGVLKARKNVLGVIRAFAEFAANHPDYFLLIAGKKGGSYFVECEAAVKELGIGEKVRFLGYVTDGELSYLYTKATALVFPSFIEGFGMPVLEAMSACLPVITSNTGALAEVAGDAALLVDPHNPTDIAGAMATYADTPSLRDTYILKGKERVKNFSWSAGAEQFLRLIKNL